MGQVAAMSGRDSTIVAELEYSIDRFEPGRCNCAMMPGRFTDGTFDPVQRAPEAYQRVNAHLSP